MSGKTFKVGDTVRIREWDDMAREFGVSDSGCYIRCCLWFSKSMGYLCGTEFVIDGIDDDGIISGTPLNGRREMLDFIITADMIELCEEVDDGEEFDTSEIQKFLSEFTKC